MFQTKYFFFFSTSHCISSLGTCIHFQIHGRGLVGFRWWLVIWASGEGGRVPGHWGDTQSIQPWHWTHSLVRNTQTQLHSPKKTVYLTQQTLHTLYSLCLGTCCHYNLMFTSSCCRGLQSSTTTRTATSQLAVCCDCSLTTQHLPGVNHCRKPTKPSWYHLKDMLIFFAVFHITCN